MSFLTAEWRKLAIANYSIDSEILKKYIPYKTELDIWEGRCYVSLVGFMFLNTRVLGLSIPWHRNFEEINLRFYVRYKDGNNWKRGVVFIKEIVPRATLTFVANTLYKEHYATMPMRHTWREEAEQRIVEYTWKCKANWQQFKVVTDIHSSEIVEGSEAEFITEHYWGYTKARDNRTFEYEVTHPKWNQYIVRDYYIAVDFEAVYGADFAFLNSAEPVSVMLAEGSEITVKGKRKI